MAAEVVLRSSRRAAAPGEKMGLKNLRRAAGCARRLQAAPAGNLFLPCYHCPSPKVFFAVERVFRESADEARVGPPSTFLDLPDYWLTLHYSNNALSRGHPPRSPISLAGHARQPCFFGPRGSIMDLSGALDALSVLLPPLNVDRHHRLQLIARSSILLIGPYMTLPSTFSIGLLSPCSRLLISDSPNSYTWY